MRSLLSCLVWAQTPTQVQKVTMVFCKQADIHYWGGVWCVFVYLDSWKFTFMNGCRPQTLEIVKKKETQISEEKFIIL